MSVITVYKPFVITSLRLIKAGINEAHENQRLYNIYKKEFKAFLTQFNFDKVNAEAFILEGNVDEQITRFAKNASILYVGSPRKSVFQRVLKGSVSERVIRDVKCAIFSVKPEGLFRLKIPAGLENVDIHFRRAKELEHLGYIKEAIVQYKAVLKLNDLHLPSIQALSKVYQELSNYGLAKYYKRLDGIIKEIDS